jgi:hypothetical protein
MNESIILLTATSVFSLLLFGLLQTMWEFSRLNKREQQYVRSVKQVDRLNTE